MFPEDVVGVEKVRKRFRPDGARSPSATLSLIRTVYLTDRLPMQRSRDAFLWGHLNLHVVRELSEVQNPS